MRWRMLKQPSRAADMPGIWGWRGVCVWGGAVTVKGCFFYIQGDLDNIPPANLSC